jgi:hypothetical protein
MAGLTSTTIAGSYERLLILPAGGLNGTNLVAITDGDSDTASVLQIATTSALINGSGSKLYFSDAAGEYISGDNDNLTIAAGTDLNLTAGTDINIPVNVGLRFGDGGENIETDNTDFTITSGAKLNLTATSDVHIANATGLVVGHTAQETISIGDGSTDLVPEVQVLGTAQADASLMLAAFSATATSAGAPLLALVKSGDAAIDGTHVIVTDGEELGNIIAYGDDGVDLESPAASIQFEVDGTPGTGDMPGRILFNTSPDGGSVLTEAMRISQDGTQNQQGNYIVNEQGRQDHVANTMPAPYYRFDGVDDVITITDDADLDFGTGNGALEILVKFADVSGVINLVGRKTDGNNQMNIVLNGGSLDCIYKVGGVQPARAITSFTPVVDTWYHIVWVIDNGVDNDIYINGVSQVLSTNTVTGGDMSLAQDILIGELAGVFMDGEIERFGIYNKALTATEVKELYSGASVPFKYKGANQTDLASGYDFTSGWATSSATVVDANTFRTNASATGSVRKDFGTKGKRTRIRVAGTTPSNTTVQVVGVDTLTNHSGNLTGTFDSTFEFLNVDTGYRIRCINTVGSTQDTDITAFTVTEIGAVAEYDGSGVGASRWDDKSGNDLHGTVSGATVENAPADADSGLTYEEGTWDAVVTDGTNPMTMNGSYDTGYYTKVGNLVTVSGEFLTTSLGSASGDIRITGLPFTVANNQAARTGGAAVYGNGFAITAGHTVSCFSQAGSTYIILNVWDATTGTTVMQASEWTADGNIVIGFSYRAA